MASVIAELTFLSTAEGGRQSPPHPIGYMPHLVVDGSVATDGSEYLGVKFIDGPKPVFGEAGIFELELGYLDRGLDYSVLVPGVTVTVREGGRVVARGRILSRH